MVERSVARDPHYPTQPATLLLVLAAAFLHRGYDAQEGFLEEITGDLPIAHHADQESEDPLLVTLDERSKGGFITVVEIGCDEGFVRLVCHAVSCALRRARVTGPSAGLLCPQGRSGLKVRTLEGERPLRGSELGEPMPYGAPREVLRRPSGEP